LPEKATKVLLLATVGRSFSLIFYTFAVSAGGARRVGGRQ